MHIKHFIYHQVSLVKKYVVFKCNKIFNNYVCFINKINQTNPFPASFFPPLHTSQYFPGRSCPAAPGCRTPRTWSGCPCRCSPWPTTRTRCRGGPFPGVRGIPVRWTFRTCLATCKNISSLKKNKFLVLKIVQTVQIKLIRV